MARDRRARRGRLLLRRLCRDRRGAVAVEFAFIAPLAILITLGAIETARAISAQAAIDHAVKETVRFAAVRGTASGAAASESQLEAMALEVADLPVAATTAAASWNPDNSPGGIVTVTMQHTFNPVTIPFEADTFGPERTATSTRLAAASTRASGAQAATRRNTSATVLNLQVGHRLAHLRMATGESTTEDRRFTTV